MDLIDSTWFLLIVVGGMLTGAFVYIMRLATLLGVDGYGEEPQ